MMQRYGWQLLFHECLIIQLQGLENAVSRARANDPEQFETNANVKLFNALSGLIFETIPANPNQQRYRQGNTMGPAYRHWRRAKIGRRFRLFFRFDSRSKIIIYAWVNDAHTLRASRFSEDAFIRASARLTIGRHCLLPLKLNGNQEISFLTLENEGGHDIPAPRACVQCALVNVASGVFSLVILCSGHRQLWSF